jgi:hypothetical protein
MLREDVDLELLGYLTPEERAELDALLVSDGTVWRPLPGPQSDAYEAQADIIGYGGAAGGGKTDLACGKSLTQHRKVGIFRLNGTELTSFLDRFEELIGDRKGYNGQDKIWRITRADGVHVQLEFGSFPNLGDEKKYQGRPHDLLVFDEAANMRETQVRFLLGWLRTTVVGQKCQALLTFNPPTTVEGRWIIAFFAPWLDKKHPNPAKPGELRWFATVDGKDIERPDGTPFTHNEELIQPLSRTFIPSRISDNPYLLGTGYMATLQAMPEPLRSQMLKGDFTAGVKDDPWQVLPTAWVEAAMERWKKKDAPGKMQSLGCDVALGGDDNTVIAQRYADLWFDEPRVYPGKDCPDGPTVAGYILAATRDGSPQHIDLFGVGAKPYGHLMEMHQDVIGVDMGAQTFETEENHTMGFFNVRSMLVWRMREALDPNKKNGIALPPNQVLLGELCAYTWEPVTLRGRTAIKVCNRDAIMEKIGRSPDYATAYVLANLDTPKSLLYSGLREKQRSEKQDYDPYARM